MQYVNKVLNILCKLSIMKYLSSIKRGRVHIWGSILYFDISFFNLLPWLRWL